MPQDSEPGEEGTAGVVTAAKAVLEDAKAEPIPEKLIELAEKLEDVLAQRRRQSETSKKQR